jgi:hypothetical protein
VDGFADESRHRSNAVQVPGFLSDEVCNCEGFRMTARHGVAAGIGAVVGKPPVKEPAGVCAMGVPRLLWGFGAACGAGSARS